ncbi:MAG: hypothetical protein ACK46G_02585 [Flavobacteriales bacterium]|jgi:UDP-2,3-diacylglucosamine hydrolase
MLVSIRSSCCSLLEGHLHVVEVLHGQKGFHQGGRSRRKNQENDRKWLGADKEWLVQYSRERLQEKHFDFLLFGHRHLPIDMEVAPGSRYVNLGDWIGYYTYATFDGQDLKLMKRTSDGPLSGDVQITGGPAV